MAEEGTKVPPEAEAEAVEPEGPEEQEELSAEDLRAELERLRQDVKAMRRWERKAKRLEKELEELKASASTPADEPVSASPQTPDAEVGKVASKLAEAQARIAALERERVDALLKSAVIAEASRLGFEYPEDVWRVIDRAELEYDDETGEVDGVAEAVREVAKSRPRWLRTGSVGVGKAGGAGSETDEQRRARLFGGTTSDFWKGGGTILNE